MKKNDFQTAAARAEARYSPADWGALSSKERSATLFIGSFVRWISLSTKKGVQGHPLAADDPWVVLLLQPNPDER